ncbi:MAG: glycosyltransferase family 2 protein [Fibromonadaceae bacterium]|nr:glycosyltransferase family 2 protein [Fibromonadaceae bacterium]
MINYELPQMKYQEQKGLISVIVPIYNNEIYLKECLDSIFVQTFTNWEALLIDDGSTDNTGKIVDEYAKKDSRFIAIHKQNGGVLSARKAGLENSKGEFIANLDHDDTYHQQYLEKMYEKITETGADFVWCKNQLEADHVDANYHVTDYKWNEDKSKNIEIMLTLAQGVSWITWDKLIKREIYAKVRFPNLNVIFGEDPIQMLQVAYNSNSAAFIPENLYFHKKGGASTRPNIISVIQTVIIIDDIFKNLFNGIVPENIKNLFYSRFCRRIAYYYYRLDKNKRKRFIDGLKPLLSESIKREKNLSLKICLFLANKRIEFPFMLWESIKNFKSNFLYFH